MNMIIDNKKIFENKLREKFPNSNFEIINFTNVNSKMIIKCLNCGSIREFKKASYLLPKKHFCRICESITFNKMKEITNDSNVSLIELSNKISIPCKFRCKKCNNSFERLAGNIVNKGRNLCPYCESKSPSHKYTNFLEKINNTFGENNYKVFNNDFIGTDKIKIQHKCGFIFYSRIYDFLKSSGCPFCNGFMSSGEKIIAKYLIDNNIKFQYQYSLPETKQRIDFFIDDKIALEYQGEFHYNAWNNDKERLKYVKELDRKKKELCIKKGYTFIEITYKDNIIEMLKVLVQRPVH